MLSPFIDHMETNFLMSFTSKRKFEFLLIADSL